MLRVDRGVIGKGLLEGLASTSSSKCTCRRKPIYVIGSTSEGSSSKRLESRVRLRKRVRGLDSLATSRRAIVVVD